MSSINQNQLSSQSTYFGQRPTRENFQFQNSNTLIADQDPSKGTFEGMNLPGLPVLSKNYYRAILEERFGGRDVLSGSFKLSPKDQSALDYYQRMNTVQKLSALASRADTRMLDINEHGVIKPVDKFLKLLAMGVIKPPKFSLQDADLQKDGETLMAAVNYLYAHSGLPRMPKAYGLSDFLAKELGSLAWYEPKDATLREENLDYNSRTTIPVSTRIAWNRLTNQALLAKKPFIPANMRCVTDVVSARLAIEAGMCPIVSYTADNANQRIEAAEEFKNQAFITVRSNKGELEVARQILSKGGNICIELANAHLPNLKSIIKELKSEFPQAFIMVGNVGSPEGGFYAMACGADAVKVGRGPGSGCTTPEETGISPGQISLAYEIGMLQVYALFYYGWDVPFILDGGISTPGHCLVAGLLGAESMMLGSKFAAAKGSPAARYTVTDAGFFKKLASKIFGFKLPEKVFVEYFGEASARAAQLDRVKFRATPQGTKGFLPEVGTIEEVSDLLAGGLRGGVADSMERSFAEFVGRIHSNQRLVETTHGSVRETATRLQNIADFKLKAEGRF